MRKRNKNKNKNSNKNRNRREIEIERVIVRAIYFRYLKVDQFIVVREIR